MSVPIPVKMYQVNGVVEPVSEDVFIESLRLVGELHEAPELLNDGMLVQDRLGNVLPGCAGASQTKSKLSREVYRVLRRKGMMGQAGIDQQYRSDNNIHEPTIDPITKKPLVFPPTSPLASSTTPHPSHALLAPVSNPLPPPVDPSVDPSDYPLKPPRPLFPEQVKTSTIPPGFSASDEEPESLEGWESKYLNVEKMPTNPAHKHLKTGKKHYLKLHRVGHGVSVAYCSETKTVYYISVTIPGKSVDGNSIGV